MVRKRGRKKRESKSIVFGGHRTVFRVGGSLVIGLPPDFIEAHGIKEGDILPFAANHIIKYIPMPEEHYVEEERNE